MQLAIFDNYALTKNFSTEAREICYACDQWFNNYCHNGDGLCDKLNDEENRIQKQAKLNKEMIQRLENKGW